MSLLRLHGTMPKNTYPDSGDIKRVASKLRFNVPPSRTPALKVGVVWTGNPQMGRNHERSIPFRYILELEENPNVQLYSLQFGAKDLQAYQAQGMVNDLTSLVGNRGYLGTAAVMKELDLIITCCTSAAHLAGAMGVPTWTLLCHDPYWVWLRDGSRSSFYPNMRLFRQSDPADWGPVIDQVKLALADRAQRFLDSQVQNA